MLNWPFIIINNHANPNLGNILKFWNLTVHYYFSSYAFFKLLWPWYIFPCFYFKQVSLYLKVGFIGQHIVKPCLFFFFTQCDNLSIFIVYTIYNQCDYWYSWDLPINLLSCYLLYVLSLFPLPTFFFTQINWILTNSTVFLFLLLAY